MDALPHSWTISRRSFLVRGLLIKATATGGPLRPHLRPSLRTRLHRHSLRHAIFGCRASSPCSRLASAAHARTVCFHQNIFKSF